MCVIIHRPATGHELTLDILKACFINNDDGWGVMHAENGRIITHRGMHWPEFEAAYKKLNGIELGIHFRIKTHGNIDLRNTHPFKVLDVETDGRDLWLMHNGTIKIEQRDTTLSDTWHYIEDELRPILRRAPDLLEEPAFLRHLEERIGWSRLLLLDGSGRFTTVAEHKGKELFGCWFSNNHSHTVETRTVVGGAATTSRGWWSHYTDDGHVGGASPFGASAAAGKSASVLSGYGANYSSSSKTASEAPRIAFLRAEPGDEEASRDSEEVGFREEYLEEMAEEMRELGYSEYEIAARLAEAEAEFHADNDEVTHLNYDPVEAIMDAQDVTWEMVGELTWHQLLRLIHHDPMLIASKIEEALPTLQAAEARTKGKRLTA